MLNYSNLEFVLYSILEGCFVADFKNCLYIYIYLFINLLLNDLQFILFKIYGQILFYLLSHPYSILQGKFLRVHFSKTQWLAKSRPETRLKLLKPVTLPALVGVSGYDSRTHSWPGHFNSYFTEHRSPTKFLGKGSC